MYARLSSAGTHGTAVRSVVLGGLPLHAPLDRADHQGYLAPGRLLLPARSGTDPRFDREDRRGVEAGHVDRGRGTAIFRDGGANFRRSVATWRRDLADNPYEFELDLQPWRAGEHGRQLKAKATEPILNKGHGSTLLHADRQAGGRARHHSRRQSATSRREREFRAFRNSRCRLDDVRAATDSGSQEHRMVTCCCINAWCSSDLLAIVTTRGEHLARCAAQARAGRPEVPCRFRRRTPIGIERFRRRRQRVTADGAGTSAPATRGASAGRRWRRNVSSTQR
jgi:hypothetical protein